MRGAVEPFSLSGPQTQQLKELSRQQGATLFMTLLAGFKLLLSGSSGQAEVVVGTPIAGRTRSEIEGLIGFFVNTLVLRTRLSGEMRVAEVLGQVREVCLGAYSHQEVPFEKLVAELEPQRSLSRTPLFQVMFALQNQAASQWRLAGMAGARPAGETGSEKVDLTLVLREQAGRLGGGAGFQPGLVGGGDGRGHPCNPRAYL